MLQYVTQIEVSVFFGAVTSVGTLFDFTERKSSNKKGEKC